MAPQLEAPPQPTSSQFIDPNRLTPLPEKIETVPTSGNPEPTITTEESPEFGTILKARVNVDKETVAPETVYTVPKGEKISLVIMDMIASGYSQDGDTFTASVKDSVFQDGKLLIPAGSLVHGHLVATEDPGKAFSKRGKMVLAFDDVQLPDGRKVPLKTEYIKGDTTLKAVGRAVGSGISGTVGGAVNGVIVALQVGGGFAGAALSHGLTLAGGAAIGGLFGLGDGLASSGDHVVLKEGDQIQVALQTQLQLPAMTAQTLTQNEIRPQGLQVNVTQYAFGQDPFKTESLLTLGLKIDNQTEYTFGSFDMALVDDYNNIYQLSPFGNSSEFAFQLQPKSRLDGTFTFSIKSPAINHYLVFYKPYTHEVFEKISLTEAFKNLPPPTKHKHHFHSA